MAYDATIVYEIYNLSIEIMPDGNCYGDYLLVEVRKAVQSKGRSGGNMQTKK